MEYIGLSVSKGIAVEQAYLYAPLTPGDYLKRIQENNKEIHQSAQECFADALRQAKEELNRLLERVAGHSPEQAKILSAHIEITEDEAMAEDIRLALEEGQPLGEAVAAVFDTYIRMFSQSKEERIRERAADLTDVRNRLLRILAGLPEQDLSALPAPCVVFANDLLPADTAGIDRRNVKAIVTEIGGETSHTSIIARSYGIPCIVGVTDICKKITSGMLVIVDAVAGRVIPGPTPEVAEEYRTRRDTLLRQKERAEACRSLPCRLLDGTAVDICVNLAQITPEALSAAEYADGVGLFRTEFLYMGRTAQPGEEEQFVTYRRVLEEFGSKPVVLRTLDIGGDKQVECLRLPREQNPFLGERALRLCFAQPELFRTQLRAALRASVYGTLWIMFPMVGSVEDFARARAMLLEEKEALAAAGVSVAENIRIGAMIEIPAMALAADALAQTADFASVGSNDLTQYLLAVDRTEPAVAKYCQKYHPAVWRCIAMASEAFVRAGKPISICGELGGDALAAPALIGCGMRKLSMSGGAVAEVKETLMRRSLAECETLSRALCAAQSAGAAEELLKAFYAKGEN